MNIPVPPRPVRRLILDPLCVVLALPLALLLGVIALVGVLVAPLVPPARLARLSALMLAYLGVELALVLGAFGLWLRHPTRRRDEANWRRSHRTLLRWGLARFLRAAHALAGLEVRMDQATSRPIPAGRLIALARHGGPGDSFVLVHLLITDLDRYPRVVLKRALQWDPGMDLLLTRLSGLFLPAPRDGGEDELDALRALAADLGPDDALLLFPEGGNWTPRRRRRAIVHLLRSGRRRSARRARRRGALLPPQPAGTVTCLAARPDADVLVIAHAGLDTLVTAKQMWRALPVRGRPMRVRWWHCPAASVSREPEAAERWLQRQWDEIDAEVTRLRGPADGPGRGGGDGPDLG